MIRHKVSYSTIGISNPVTDIRSATFNGGYSLTTSGIKSREKSQGTANSYFDPSYEVLKFSSSESYYYNQGGNVRVANAEQFSFYKESKLIINASDKRIVLKNKNNIPVYLEPLYQTIKDNPNQEPILKPIYEEFKGRVLILRTIPYISPRYAMIKNSFSTDIDLYEFYENRIKSRSNKNDNIDSSLSLTDQKAIQFIVNNYNNLSEQSIRGEVFEYINCHQLLTVKVSLIEKDTIIVNDEFLLSSKNIFDVEDFPEEIDGVLDVFERLGGTTFYRAYLVNNGAIAGKKYINFSGVTIEVESIQDPAMKSGLYIDKIKDSYANIENILFISVEDMVAKRTNWIFDTREEAILHRELSFDKIREAQEKEREFQEEIKRLKQELDKKNYEIETIKTENTILEHKMKSELAAAKFVQDTKKIEREMVKDTTKFNNELILGLTTAIGGVIIGTTLARK